MCAEKGWITLVSSCSCLNYKHPANCVPTFSSLETDDTKGQGSAVQHMLLMYFI